jgi:hypothetical protein
VVSSSCWPYPAPALQTLSGLASQCGKAQQRWLWRPSHFPLSGKSIETVERNLQAPASLRRFVWTLTGAWAGLNECTV